jgi:Mn-dependent DtxR family transcriptional regulator
MRIRNGSRSHRILAAVKLRRAISAHQPDQAALAELIGAGLVVRDGDDRYSLTPEGRRALRWAEMEDD